MTHADDEQAIRDVITAWSRATAMGDLAKLKTLMTEDVVFLTPGDPPTRGRDAFLQAFQAGLAKWRIDSDATVGEIQVAGSFAYSWCHLAVKMTPLDGGPARQRAGYTLTVWKKTRAGWAIARDANLLAAEPPPSIPPRT